MKKDKLVSKLVRLYTYNEETKNINFISVNYDLISHITNSEVGIVGSSPLRLVEGYYNVFIEFDSGDIKGVTRIFDTDIGNYPTTMKEAIEWLMKD